MLRLIMPRIPRLVVPGYPHHVTQRGNRRQRTFFNVEDYQAYLKFIATAKPNAGCDIWAYCLMPNHVHFVIVPQHENSLALLFKEAHRCYTRRINFREKWRGHLWQERFHSFVMDEPHLNATVKYVELNPVSAGLCENPQDWHWSSIHAHLSSKDDELVSVKPMLERFPRWVDYLGKSESNQMRRSIRMHTRTGRPLGSESFIETLELKTGRSLKPRKPGRKPIK
jgi:putative transposase